MARRKEHRTHLPRPGLALNPAIGMTLGAIALGIGLLGLAWLAAGDDSWFGLIWALPGFYILLQPLRGIVRGSDQQLRIALHKIDLSKLTKVAVYERTQWGLTYGVAVLRFPDHVEEVLGSFLTTRSFTRLVEWFGVPIEVLQGAWTPRQLAAARPDLIPARGAVSKKK